MLSEFYEVKFAGKVVEWPKPPSVEPKSSPKPDDNSWKHSTERSNELAPARIRRFSGPLFNVDGLTQALHSTLRHIHPSKIVSTIFERTEIPLNFSCSNKDVSFLRQSHGFSPSSLKEVAFFMVDL